MRKQLFLSSPSSRRGIALISVLAIVVLITGLVVAFLVRAGNEKIATSHYDATSTSRVLSDTVVNLVQATISEATTVQAEAGQKSAWASQPGAIRVYGESGSLQKVYRLYSAPSLVTTTANANVLADDLPPADWGTQTAQWVDLNAPAQVSGMGDPFLAFPILDPRNPADPGTITAPKVTTIMPGFSISGAPGQAADLIAQPAPMPVRWLYVLQDGKIVSPSTGSSAGVAIIPGASSSNPITGRIAFWTDDETAKVNINTAAGSISKRNGVEMPSPWETPKFKMWEERMLFSENQPVQAEYQRYPGHPATTDLYGIMKALNVTTTGYPAVMATYSASPQPSPASTASAFYKLLPRYADDNSSHGGAANTTVSGTPAKINGGYPKRERLYTSIGELLYDSQRNPTGLSRQQIASGTFFLTAHSRSPEVTLFGTPRVSMWPVNFVDSTTTRTAFDKLIAFCSTIVGSGGTKYPYYFQRNNARSGSSDYDGIARNKQLYLYLKNLTNREIPGFGGKFQGRYNFTGECDQILTEMVDYIRSVNTYDHSLPATNTTFKRFTTNPTGLSGGKSQVTPLRINEGGVPTRGLGRIQTLSEIGIQIICTAEGSAVSHRNRVSGTNQTPYANPETIGGQNVSPMQGSANDAAYSSNLPVDQYLRDGTGTNGKIIGWISSTHSISTTGTETALPSDPGVGPFPANPTLTTTGDYGGSLTALSPGDKKLQAMLLFEVSCPMMGFDPFDTAIPPSWQLEVSNIQGISIASQNPFPSRTTTGEALAANQNGNGPITSMSTRVNTIQGTGGSQGFRYLMLKYSSTQGNLRYNGWSGKSPYGAAQSPYRFVSNPFTLTSGSTTLPLSGNFKVELKVPTSSTATETYQTFNVSFPSVSTPIPNLSLTGLRTGNTTDTQVWGSNWTVPADWWGFDNRIAWATIKVSLESTNVSTTQSPIQSLGAVIRGDKAVTGLWNYALTDKIVEPLFTSQPAATSADVVRTLVAKDGDYRLIAAVDPVTADGTTHLVKGPGYDGTSAIGNLFRDQSSSLGTAGSDQGGKLVKNATYSWSMVPKVPATLPADKMKTWDWDNGLPAEKDGSYGGKADEGNTYVNGGSSPYYNGETQISNDISSYFTANRIVNSAVTFGSLPTGVKEGVTWRTLLFRPQKVSGTVDAGRPYDPAVTTPKDHLFLDLFNMPVVEPYAISEPFSSAGKINMNYQIVPFTYINRSTGVQAVLSSEMIPRVNTIASSSKGAFDQNTYYKGMAASSTPETLPSGKPSLARLALNMSETNGTLRQFKEKFTSWDLFRSASEICDIYLVPLDPSNPTRYLWTSNDVADAGWYGEDFGMVGDSARERPYGNLYPRLTTKSNTFTVHYKVQALKNPTGSSANQWIEGKGTIQGEYRGSTTLERYLNPTNSSIEDYATDFSAPSLDKYYQWRIVSNSAFSP